MKSKLAIWGFIVSVVPIGLFFIVLYLVEGSSFREYRYALQEVFFALGSPWIILPSISVIGAILCIMAIFRIRKNQNLSGNGFAIWGIILAVIHVLIGYVINSIATGQ